MRLVFKIAVVAIVALAAGFFIYGSFFYEATKDSKDNIEVRLVLQDHKFNLSEVRVPANKPFVIYIKNNDPVPEDAFFAALRIEKFVAPNAEARLQMRPLRPGRYEMTGEYHATSAKTVFIVE